MLVLERSEGDWVEVRHSSGDVLRIRTYRIRTGPKNASVRLAFDDAERNFEITRPERINREPRQA